MKCYGIVGWKNAGKTTLIERLLEHFSGRGIRVSTLKHAHHDFDIDQRGRDSFRHRAAGAREVLVASANRWALIHENPEPTKPVLEEMLARLGAADLVLIEGFKRAPHPKIEVSLAEATIPLISAQNKTITALATNYAVRSPLKILDIDNIKEIADYIAHEVGL